MTTLNATARDGSEMRYATLPVKSLVIDKRYQRELDERRVQKIVNDFNPRLLGTLEVSSRSANKAAVFDGQHRLAALTDLGLEDVPCIVHDGLTAREEADLFIALQRERRNVSPVERFRARVFAGDKVAKEIKKTVEAAGYFIPDYNSATVNGHRAIRAVTTLERIITKGGAGSLYDALELSKRIWDDDPKVGDGLLIEGLWLLRQDYGNRIGSEEIGRLSEISPKVILRRATGNAAGGGGWTAHAVMAELRKVAGLRGRPPKPEMAA